jgi:tetratricopeptide (TPR) repeat protein
MSLTDSRGVPVSSTNRQSVDDLDRAFGLFQGYFNDPLAEIDATLAEDPDFVMGHCFRAGLFLVSSEKAAVPELEASVAEVEKRIDRANDRERGHLAAAKAWLAGDFHEAANRYGDVVAAYPRDMIAMQFAHQCDFLLGQSRMLRDRVAWVLPHWARDEASRGYLLGMYAFGLEEMGHYGEAEAAAREAVAQNPSDAWAVHALAHVFEMQGRTAEGIDFMESTSTHWAPGNGFAYHNWWHLALYYLDRKEYDRVTELYDRAVHPASTDVLMELVDAASLLWRLQLIGHDVGDRWDDVVTVYERQTDDGYYVFNDLHAMMAFVSTGRRELAERLLATLERRVGDSDSNAVMTREVGLPTCQAIEAFGRGDYDRVIALLRPARLVAHRFGGSHAQRDVLDWTMIEAALRGGHYAFAEAVANERAARKPESPTARWLHTRAIANRVKIDTAA